MRSILFLKTTDPLSDRIESMVRSLDCRSLVEVYRTIESLELRLRSVGERPSFVLLSVPDRETLEAIIDLSDLLPDAPLVEIISDDSEEAVSLAHRLRPRYLHNHKGKLEQLISVLKKMASNNTPV